jgi:hypothetical protein
MTEAKGIKQVIKANYLQPAFLICVVVLTITAIAMSVTIKLSGILLKKEPLMLKTPLSQLNVTKLAPYKVATKQQIDNQDVLETLGTEDYIQWFLEDTSQPDTSKVRSCMLFITYYPLPDLIPHVPEECYIGGGLRHVSSEAVNLTVNKGAGERQVAVRYSVFAEKGSDFLMKETNFPIFYVFSVNGEYASGREDTRLILNKNLFGKYSYFSKVEWKFFNNKFGRITYPDKHEALAASEKLMTVILPILETEHWPHPDGAGW